MDLSATWQMGFNIKKYSVMHISNKINVYQSQYTTNGDNFGLVHHHHAVPTSLGVKFFNTHTSHLSIKSYIRLYQHDSV